MGEKNAPPERNMEDGAVWAQTTNKRMAVTGSKQPSTQMPAALGVAAPGKKSLELLNRNSKDVVT
jgi:hypothetical protein